MRISKSKYIAGVQCLKRLYWQVHEPGLAAMPDASGVALMEQGQEVGLLARQLFPGGIDSYDAQMVLWVIDFILLGRMDAQMPDSA
jgi:hypothetical protein